MNRERDSLQQSQCVDVASTTEPERNCWSLVERYHRLKFGNRPRRRLAKLDGTTEVTELVLASTTRELREGWTSAEIPAPGTKPHLRGSAQRQLRTLEAASTEPAGIPEHNPVPQPTQSSTTPSLATLNCAWLRRVERAARTEPSGLNYTPTSGELSDRDEPPSKELAPHSIKQQSSPSHGELVALARYGAFGELWNALKRVRDERDRERGLDAETIYHEALGSVMSETTRPSSLETVYYDAVDDERGLLQWGSFETCEQWYDEDSSFGAPLACTYQHSTHRVIPIEAWERSVRQLVMQRLQAPPPRRVVVITRIPEAEPAP